MVTSPNGVGWRWDASGLGGLLLRIALSQPKNIAESWEIFVGPTAQLSLRVSRAFPTLLRAPTAGREYERWQRADRRLLLHLGVNRFRIWKLPLPPATLT